MRDDFTSAHFLGLRPSGSSAALTTGRPAAAEHDVGAPLALRLARAHGAEAGLLGRTSLHVLLDVLATRAPGSVVVVDEGAYPIGRWAAAAVSAETEVVTYAHHDVRDAARRLPRRSGAVVLTDGLCGSCLRPAPLVDLADLVERRGAELVVDDTLAAGVLGRRAARATVLGRGGGGTWAWLGSPATGVMVASLAKGLSAPLAVATGSAQRIRAVRDRGPTRVHAGPPTTSDVHALRGALEDATLDGRRDSLARCVLRVRRTLVDLGLRPLGVPFPVVATEGGRHDPLELQRLLIGSGVRTLATTGRCTGRPTLSLCVRHDHGPTELDRLEHALARAVGRRAA